MYRIMSIILMVCMGVSLFSAGTYANNEVNMSKLLHNEENLATAKVWYADMSDHWASEAAYNLGEVGIIKGLPNGKFNPDQPISRAEFAVMLFRIFGYVEESFQSFKDVNSTDWYADEVAKVHEAGIITGYLDGNFRPKDNIMRQDAAIMMVRAMHLDEYSNNVDLGGFSDANDIGEYAKVAVEKVVSERYLHGDINGMLNPLTALTRGEAVVLLDRAFRWFGYKSGNNYVTEIQGNAVIQKADIRLSDTVIHGNLYITEGVGEGNVFFDRVTVKGTTFIEGGGSNSIHFSESHLEGAVLSKKGGGVRLVLDAGSTVKWIVMKRKSVLEVSLGSKVDNVQINSEAHGSEIYNNGVIGRLRVNSESATLNGKVLEKGSDFQPNEPNLNNPIGVPPVTGPGNSSSDWNLVWSDEFNDNAIDTTKWNVEDTGTVYNNELEYYHPDNVSIAKDGDKGVLQLTALKQDFGGSNYTSGKVTSKMKGDWTYGKFVVRAKLPVQQGMWPAIWMMPTDEFEQYGPWPGSGEMDIMELTGPVAADPDHADKYPRTVHGSIHYDSPHTMQTKQYVLPDGQTFNDDYHEFTMEWLPGLIRYYVDGHLFFESSDWGTKREGQPEYYTYPAPFDRPFYMIMNLAVGGDWPGDPRDDFESDKMYIDYVRVYEYKNLDSWPDVTGNRPDPSNGITPQREPLADGNQIYNGMFNGGTNNYAPKDWEFILNENGDGSVSIVDDQVKGKAAKVEVTNEGNQIYSIQLTQQPMYLKKGKTYKATFDAKADTNRSIMTKLTEFGGEWKAYSEERTFELSDQWQSYEYTFKMEDMTDNNSRFEFNLGLSTIASYFTNVKVTEIDGVKEPRKALKDGNLIYNGNFDLGKDRLAFWQYLSSNEAESLVSVTNDLDLPYMQRILKVNIAKGGSSLSDVKLIHNDLPLKEGASYTLTFDAQADTNRPIGIALDTGTTEGVEFKNGSEINLTTEMQSYTIDMKILEGTNASSSNLELLLGEHVGTVAIDNVRLILRYSPSENEVKSYLHMAAHSYWAIDGVTLQAGSEGGMNITDFAAGAYVKYKQKVNSGIYIPMARVKGNTVGSEITLSIWNEEKRIAVVNASISDDDQDEAYKTILFSKIDLPDGELIFKIEGTDFDLAWLELSEDLIVNGSFQENSNDWELFKMDWVQTDPVKNSVMEVEDGQLKVNLGGPGTEPWHVQLKQPGIPMQSGKVYRLYFEAASDVSRDIVALVQHDGTHDGNWATYLENQMELTPEMTEFEYYFVMPADEFSAVLQFSMGKIGSIEGEHTVTLDNISLIQVNPVNVGIVDDGDLMPNGDFTTGIKGWNSYSTENEELSIQHENGALRIDVGTVGSNSWDRQVYYEGLPYNNGDRYKLTFEAKSTVDRKMNISVGWLDEVNNYTWNGYGSQIINLGTQYELYTFYFNVEPDSTIIGRLTFELGQIDSDDGAASIYIDNISLVNEGPTSGS
ncbi:MAG: carbohydrate binding domain-containing protein [Candidatus Pristimantibacillus lignocellulolyticus]|uniref:Carbohydrate binding domain-containing protein n=1 Tax=Candidatus Pristimantibacillus lignocellulolyticus TaxID=2994561 RepID=A0A9J6ZGG9_9BACL|nr:MAG: carbohydrate binding domain-containing protein [Candidatus Pristimantibacillus lignocellulolyticus]